jgi:hypothetical protein
VKYRFVFSAMSAVVSASAYTTAAAEAVTIAEASSASVAKFGEA